MACFADVNVSQGSVATYARCGGIFNIRLTADLLRNIPVKTFKSVQIWQNYGHVSPLFLVHPIYTYIHSYRDLLREISLQYMHSIKEDSLFVGCKWMIVCRVSK